MREKELRLALVCYGGISLAVYMHGITKEIWHLVRASHGHHAGGDRGTGSQAVYRDLLDEIEAQGALKVRVLADIIAGASAGGINGIFLAQAIATGQSLVLLLIVSVIGFVVLNLIPGGPLAQFGLDPSMTQDDLDRLKEQLGLNRPLWMQYLDWAWRLVQGDWGHSFRDGAPVLDVIGRHIFYKLRPGQS